MRFARNTHIRDRSTQAEEGERIAKVIARAGICSRRDAERLIADGRVTLNGKRLDSPAVNVTDADRIVVDGAPLPQAQTARLWRYHKPKGRVTTHKDPEGRPTVFEAMPPEMPRVISIGRLDFNTEGLLLLTNDGTLARHLESPSSGWLRRYRVRAHGDITQVELDKVKDGVEIDGIRYGPIEAKLDRVQGANVWITLGIREGKNREVRKVMEHLRLSVTRLIRLSFGPFSLGDLEVGQVEEIKRRVIAEQLGAEMADKLGLAQKRQDAGGKPAKSDGGGKPKPEGGGGGRATAKPRRPGPKPRPAANAKPAAKAGAKPGVHAKPTTNAKPNSDATPSARAKPTANAKSAARPGAKPRPAGKRTP